MGLFGQDNEKKLLKARNCERMAKIKSLQKAMVKNDSIENAIAHKLKSLSSNLPAMTVSPSHATYKVIGLVTASANSGTETRSNSTKKTGDWIGKESETINEKTANVESKVINRLKVQASKFGANAVIGVGLDFEVQSRTNLSIAAQGTAVIFDEPKDILIDSQIKKLGLIEKARLDYNRVLDETEKINDQIKQLESEIER
jgi:uncharacterized protein YbjQ (UPF0145 family)